jgi:hypothetical protein
MSKLVGLAIAAGIAGVIALPSIHISAPAPTAQDDFVASYQRPEASPQEIADNTITIPAADHTDHNVMVVPDLGTVGPQSAAPLKAQKAQKQARPAKAKTAKPVKASSKAAPAPKAASTKAPKAHVPSVNLPGGNVPLVSNPFNVNWTGRGGVFTP